MSSLLESLERNRWLRYLLAALLCAPAAWQLGLAASVFAGRYDYPFDIDWLESSALYQAWRMMNGQFTYAAPERGYLPLFHPIGYPAILAAVGKVTGLDYGVARLLSVAAFAGTVGVAGFEVSRHTDHRAHGLVLAVLSAGLGAACLPFSGGFYDMVRCDTVSWLCCALAAAIASRDELSHRRIIGIAFFMVLGVYTRLLTVFPCAWVGLWVLWRDRRAGIRLAVYVIAGCGLVLAALQLMSDGWYFTYTVTLLQKHEVHSDRLLRGARFIIEFLPYSPVLLVAGAVLAQRRELSTRSSIWLGVFVMSIPAALLPFGKDGGHDNDFMPIGLFVGPATAMIILEVARAMKDRARVAAATPWVLGAATATFLLLRPYDVSAYVPSPDRWRRAQGLNEMVARLDGGVVAPCHPFLPVRNGHRNDQYSEMPYIDAFWSKLPGLALGDYIDQSGAEWMLLTGFEIPDTAREIVARYEKGEGVKIAPDMMVGQQMRLRYLLKRKRQPTRSVVLFDFEAGVDGWAREGLAFEFAPTGSKPEWQTPIRGAGGEQLVNSYHPAMGDRATGTLTSPTFTIDRDWLAVAVGGGVGVGVQLIVDDQAVLGAYPVLFNKELLVQVTLDVRPYLGQDAQLRIYDNNTGPWGHVLVDDVVLYDTAAE